MKTILIIEDNLADQFLGKAIFNSKRPDVTVHIASDGQEALELLNEGNISPDLILLDINMPRMNGHEFLKEYSEDNKREIPVVVMLTSSDQEQDKEQSFAYKCVKEYLQKPIKFETIERLEQVVAKSYG